MKALRFSFPIKSYGCFEASATCDRSDIDPWRTSSLRGQKTEYLTASLWSLKAC